MGTQLLCILAVVVTTLYYYYRKSRHMWQSKRGPDGNRYLMKQRRSWRNKEFQRRCFGGEMTPAWSECEWFAPLQEKIQYRRRRKYRGTMRMRAISVEPKLRCTLLLFWHTSSLSHDNICTFLCVTTALLCGSCFLTRHYLPLSSMSGAERRIPLSECGGKSASGLSDIRS